MARSRSRSRERYRRRSRSHDRGRRRSRSPRDRLKSVYGTSDPTAVERLQQQQLQKQLMAQQLIAQQQATVGAPSSGNKKQREIYVGNLTVGVVSAEMLRDLFNGALAHLVQDPAANPPVVTAALDPSGGVRLCGRFGFVEMRTEELATAAMQLDKVELCGRPINVGRPKGYVEPMDGPAGGNVPGIGAPPMFPGLLPGSGPMPNMPGGQIAPLPGNLPVGQYQPISAPISSAPSNILVLSRISNIPTLRNPDERQELYEEVYAECDKYADVEAVIVPPPPDNLPMHEPGRVFIKVANTEQAMKCKKVFDGRLFDNKKVQARMIPESDFDETEAGAWIELPPAGGLPAPPGVYARTPLTINIAGIAALAPQMAGQVQANPALSGMMFASINEDAVPLEEGWVKLRGLEPQVTKDDILRFFEECAPMAPEKVRMVHGVDGRATGEAYVHISGDAARLRFALAKDRMLMPASTRPVEVFTSGIEELDRRIALQGVSYT